MKITEYVDPSRVNGEVLVKLTSDVQAIAKSWVLKVSHLVLRQAIQRQCASLNSA